MELLRIFLSLGLLFGLGQDYLFAQSADSLHNATIIGVWVMDAEIQIQSIRMAERKGQDPLQEHHLKSQTETMRSRTYIFHEGGEFQSSWVSRGELFTIAGKWQSKKDGTLEIDLEDGASLLYATELNEASLSLSQAGMDKSASLELHLKRIEQ
jgi:hypothetical protein